ncbi:MAG: hypothetical protein WAV41_03785 [Microgenomates group bacterium]
MIHKSLQLLHKTLISYPSIVTNYFDKWGIRPENLITRLSDTNFHGGIESKIISIHNLPSKKYSTTLDIGPETGIEIFLLSEISAHLQVADPDEDNLILLKSITDKALPIYSKNIKYIPCGLDNSHTYLAENSYYTQLKKIQKNSIPTFYHLTSTSELANLDSKFDLIYIHKIISTISRSQKTPANSIFHKSLDTLFTKLNKKGIISWTEPKFFWDQQKLTIPDKYKTKVIDYQLSNTADNYRQLLITHD